jgi:hypothetical protein
MGLFEFIWVWTAGRTRADPRQRREDFFSNLCVQTGSGAHPSSCTMGTGGPFPGGKARLWSDADHSPVSSTEVENEHELYLAPPPSFSVAYSGTALALGGGLMSMKPLKWGASYKNLGTSALA